MAKKRSSGRRKRSRGLGCGPGPVSGDCRYGRPLAGLRGIARQHAAEAADLANGAREHAREGTCRGAIAGLRYASRAVAEAQWVPGERQKYDRLEVDMERNVLAACGCKGR